tara:strand:+ start:569 stop:802 length:234 start_codon:yes stop_codon:yes gene_type:complete
MEKKLFFFKLNIDKKIKSIVNTIKFLLSNNAKLLCGKAPVKKSDKANLLLPREIRIKQMANGKLANNVKSNLLYSFL